MGNANDQKLVLFDIDGTLLMSVGAGKSAMIKAFRELFGVKEAFANVHMSGRTDPEILRHAFTVHNIEWDEVKAANFKNRYIQLIQTEITQPLPNKRMMPGIPVVLDVLREKQNISLGLLTGNWRRSALIKLNYFNLTAYFEVGAYADDSEIREELLPFAVQRYQNMTNTRVLPQHVYVVGDTPRDVQCARPHGAVTIAVATGWTTYEQLSAENPDYLLVDLTDFDTLLTIFQ